MKEGKSEGTEDGETLGLKEGKSEGTEDGEILGTNDGLVLMLGPALGLSDGIALTVGVVLGDGVSRQDSSPSYGKPLNVNDLNCS